MRSNYLENIFVRLTLCRLTQPHKRFKRKKFMIYGIYITYTYEHLKTKGEQHNCLDCRHTHFTTAAKKWLSVQTQPIGCEHYLLNPSATPLVNSKNSHKKQVIQSFLCDNHPMVRVHPPATKLKIIYKWAMHFANMVKAILFKTGRRTPEPYFGQHFHDNIHKNEGFNEASQFRHIPSPAIEGIE